MYYLFSTVEEKCVR